MEITCRDHSIIACSRYIYMCVLRAHPVRGESHIQRNANGEVATEARVVLGLAQLLVNLAISFCIFVTERV